MDTFRPFTPEEIENFAAQAAEFQKVNNANGVPYEDEWSIPRMLLAAFGAKNATQITNRMVQILHDQSDTAPPRQTEAQ